MDICSTQVFYQAGDEPKAACWAIIWNKKQEVVHHHSSNGNRPQAVHPSRVDRIRLHSGKQPLSGEARSQNPKGIRKAGNKVPNPRTHHHFFLCVPCALCVRKLFPDVQPQTPKIPRPVLLSDMGIFALPSFILAKKRYTRYNPYESAL